MGAVAAALADVALVTDDNPRSEDPAAIRAQILAGAKSAPRTREHQHARAFDGVVYWTGDQILDWYLKSAVTK